MNPINVSVRKPSSARCEHPLFSRPCPVCYGHGGAEPTVTDALVVLGRIDADNFLGGAMQLDRDAALAACARVDKPLGLDAEETA